MKILYLTIDGLLDDLGQSQILSYINGLSSKDLSFNIISFEKKERNDGIEKLRLELEDNNIKWKKFRYISFPPIVSTIINVLKAFLYVSFSREVKKVDVVHVRSYVMGLVAILLNKFFKIPFIFDMRGWWIDEKIESGLWVPIFYRPVEYFYRFIERVLFKNSIHVICLTKLSALLVEQKFSLPPCKITVIPTCVNKEFFFQMADLDELTSIKQDMLIPKKSFVFIYSGSIGGYYKTEEILKIFKELLFFKPDAYFIILTKTIEEDVLSYALELGIEAEKIKSLHVPFQEVNKYLNIADLGLVLYTDGFSSTARSPTKLAEYWSTGLPVLSPKGLGDLDFLYSLNPNGGLQFDGFNVESYRKCLSLFFTTSLSSERRKTSVKPIPYFDLKVGIQKYARVYAEVLSIANPITKVKDRH